MFFSFQMANYLHLFIRQLHRITCSRSLARIIREADDDVFFDTIVSELDGTGFHLGESSMHDRHLKIHHVYTDRETVRLILKVIDPKAVYCRKQRRLKRRIYSVQGPNSLWHIDGWDKLKKGLCIHGAIDGFSVISLLSANIFHRQ